jgi:hypothetical protein
MLEMCRVEGQPEIRTRQSLRPASVTSAPSTWAADRVSRSPTRSARLTSPAKLYSAAAAGAAGPAALP